MSSSASPAESTPPWRQSCCTGPSDGSCTASSSTTGCCARTSTSPCWLRKDEYESVLASYQDMGLNVRGVDATELFLKALEGISDPEAKRKAIGRTFIEVFDAEAHKIENASWLAQGTIYPDVIESTSVNGPSQTIKSHHNVGGLPEEMNLRIVEPLRSLFKDEVRRVGRALGIKNSLISRHPFPGPGLGIRVLGEVTREKLEILRNADAIYIDALRSTPAPEGWQPASGAAATGAARIRSSGHRRHRDR